jgi:hypothetical protein
VVGLRPGVPLEGHVAAGGDGDRGLTRRSFLDRDQLCNVISHESSITLWQITSPLPKDEGSTNPLSWFLAYPTRRGEVSIVPQMFHWVVCFGLTSIEQRVQVSIVSQTLRWVSSLPRRVAFVVDPLRSSTSNGLAVGDDFLDVTVSRDGRNDSKSCENGSSAGGVHLDRHIEGRWWR